VHPALTLFGHGPVPAYELMLALGACALVAVVAGSAARGALPRHRVLAWISGTYVAAIVGARAAFAASMLPAWNDALAALSRTDVAGFSSVGGLVAGALAAWRLARRLELPLDRLSGPLVLGGCLLGAAARAGCFLAGCCHGRPTTLPWGVVYPPWAEAARLYGPSVAVHPSPLYEAALLLGIAAWLAWPASPRTVARAAGAAAAYLLGRFALDVLRGDTVRYEGLTPAQWLVLGVLIAGAAAAAARASRGARATRVSPQVYR
jgi:phosphatidylglycerol:prolipoprotein diacylglycerol transferase